jgi:hypothetical protein
VGADHAARADRCATAPDDFRGAEYGTCGAGGVTWSDPRYIDYGSKHFSTLFLRRWSRIGRNRRGATIRVGHCVGVEDVDCLVLSKDEKPFAVGVEAA